MANRIQLRRDTASNWTRVNPVLDDGEPGLNIDNNQIKYGDGNTAWNDLEYAVEDRLANGEFQVVLGSDGNTTFPVGGIIPPGGIIMWSGSVGSIPTGWALCDGTGGTPNLRDKFVVGAGTTYAVGATGGSKDAIVVSHSHTASVSITDPGHRHWISGGQKDDANFNSQGSNTQEYGLWADGATYSADDPNHAYGRYSLGNTTGISASSSVDSAGSSGTNANLPPYYALCFIMKL
jgi:microcystin-dependent protein